jgi:tryptophan synthase
MGVTGSSANTAMSTSLPDLCKRVRKFAVRTPIAVGFGVNTREHFLSVGSMADGVVIGSKIVSIIKESPPQKIEDSIRQYCLEVSRPRRAEEISPSHHIDLHESLELAKVDSVAKPTAKILSLDPDQTPNHDIDGLQSGSNGLLTHAVLVFGVTLTSEITPTLWGIWWTICS